jgi:hypothetical protein
MRREGARRSDIARVRFPLSKAWLPAIAAVALLTASAQPARGQVPETLLSGMAVEYARVERYTARFVRQEMIDGTLRPREEALLKFQRPGLLYLRWVAGPPAGREILFVPGRHDNRMLVREPGLLTSLATIVMAPDSPRVLEESRHPVTDIGVGRLVELILDNARRAATAGELLVRDLGAVTEPDGPGRRIEVVLPRRPERGYYCHRLDLIVAAGTGLPVRATVYDWDDRMVADYTYLDFMANPPLTALDFDAANPEYKFSRWKIVR